MPRNVVKDICFTIMPFGEWCERYYEAIYSPAIKAAGLEPHKANDLYRPSAIVSDIWQYTKKAKIILADLSGKNPNVFYELGLAHAIAKPAILVTESLDDVPYDLRALRIIEYDKNSPDWGNELKIKITTAIKEVIPSPNESVPATFLDTEGVKLPKTVTAEEKEKIQEEQEKKLAELSRSYELLRSEMHYRLNDIRHREILHRPDPAEAKIMIRNYLKRGLDEPVILDRLISVGVPGAWASREIRKLKKIYKP